MGTHPIFESDFDCLTEIVMSARLIPGRLLFSGLGGTGGAARFGLTCVAGAVFLETVFTEWSEDWFMNTYNAGKSFQSVLQKFWHNKQPWLPMMMKTKTKMTNKPLS